MRRTWRSRTTLNAVLTALTPAALGSSPPRQLSNSPVTNPAASASLAPAAARKPPAFTSSPFAISIPPTWLIRPRVAYIAPASTVWPTSTYRDGESGESNDRSGVHRSCAGSSRPARARTKPVPIRAMGIRGHICNLSVRWPWPCGPDNRLSTPTAGTAPPSRPTAMSNGSPHPNWSTATPASTTTTDPNSCSPHPRMNHSLSGSACRNRIRSGIRSVTMTWTSPHPPNVEHLWNTEPSASEPIDPRLPSGSILLDESHALGSWTVRGP